eukprot:309041_1
MANVIILFLFANVIIIFLIFSQVLAVKQDKFLAIYGETGTGKSSIINAIFNEHVAETAHYGDGFLVTQQPMVYFKNMNNFTLHIMDTPGFTDNRFMISDEDILQNTLLALSQTHTNQIDVILLSESLLSDNIQLTQNLNKMTQLFGRSVMKSIVVLGTKANLSKQIYGDVRIKTVQKLCKRLELKYLTYDSLQSCEYENQFKLFLDIIFGQDIVPYKMDKVSEVRQKIESRAVQLMNDAESKYKTVQIPTRIIKYKQSAKIETYFEKQWGVVARGKRKQYIFGWFPIGDKTEIYGWKPVEKRRTVTYNEAYEVVEFKNKTIEIPKDIETFREMARIQWKDSLKLKTDIITEL